MQIMNLLATLPTLTVLLVAGYRLLDIRRHECQLREATAGSSNGPARLVDLRR